MNDTPAEIRGTWQPIRAEMNGVAAPQLALEKMELVIEARRYAVRFGGHTADAGTIALLGSGEHLELNLTATAGDNSGRSVPAIAQVRGDRLRVCFGMNGVIPQVFASAGGTDRYLVTYRRMSV